MKKVLPFLLVPVMLLSACSSLPQQAQDVINSPAVQALIAQAEQFAIQFAENWIMSHLGARKAVYKLSDAGVSSLKAQLMVQYKLSDQLAGDIALAAFAKANH